MIGFQKNILNNYKRAAAKEWLVTNGIGAYASSTICGANTRRYHGLLVSAIDPPLSRMVILSKVDETIHVNHQSYHLGVNQYPQTIYPKGYEYLELFSYEYTPKYIYKVGDIRIEKNIHLIYEKNAVILYYKLLESPSPIYLSVQPFFACRRYHELTRENPFFNMDVDHSDGFLCLKPYKASPLIRIFHNQATFDKHPLWYNNFEYKEEKNRGLGFNEDLYTPGELTYSLSPGETCFLLVSTDELTTEEIQKAEETEINYKNNLIKNVDPSDKLAVSLILASDTFIIKRGTSDQKSIIAGYPWFTDWGRDTMISLPGLTLTTGRFKLAKKILSTFANYCSEGMLPNRFPDEGRIPDYNTVDASFWFFHAAHQYFIYTGDDEYIRLILFPIFKEIIAWHEKGTRYNIHVASDGLIEAGTEDTQLTWMDAKIGNEVITPRVGKPVEVNALWYNALRVMSYFSDRFGQNDLHEKYKSMAAKAKRNFNKSFWNNDKNCLYDVLGPNNKCDASIRPNQIIAISLPYTVLKEEYQKPVLDRVSSELLTPYGLRTLSPKDPRYMGQYKGNMLHRDRGYHQGTVWPWLIGPFATAYLKVMGRKEKTIEYIRELIEPFRDQLYEAGIGTISELYDGDPPHKPNGCISQAWSVAEILRVISEDINLKQPARETLSTRSIKH